MVNNLDAGQKAIIKEIKRVEKALRGEILRVEEKVEKLDDKTQKQHDEVMTSISNFAGRVDVLETENVLGTEHYEDHEARISKLESSL